ARWTSAQICAYTLQKVSRTVTNPSGSVDSFWGVLKNILETEELSVLAYGLVAAANSSQKTAAGPEGGQAVGAPQASAQTSTQGELKGLLYTDASDECQGRESGEPGQKKAVEYLRAFYQDLGIPAAKADGDYFQQVPLELAKVPSGNVSINGRVYELGENLVAFSGAQGEYREVAYAGYGVRKGTIPIIPPWRSRERSS